MSLALEYLKQMALLDRMMSTSWNMSLGKGFPAGGWCKKGEVSFSLSYGMSGYIPDGLPKYPKRRRLGRRAGPEEEEYLVRASLLRESMDKPDLPEKMREFMGTLADVYENIHKAKPTEDDFDKLSEWMSILFVSGCAWPSSE